MSHSAHRFGTREELRRDYVIFVRPARGLDDINEETRQETLRKTKELADIAFKYGPVNIGRTGAGCTGQGEDYHEIMNCREFNGFMSVFTDKGTATEVLREFKEKDAGFSVVASGLTEDIFDICKGIGLKPHTILYSLGVWGKTELLPSEDHLKIITLCGHSMISSAMIDHYVEEIKKGDVTPEEAGKKLAKTCPCGIFNVPRTAEVLRTLAGL
ncbi:MAG: hypothetical protein GTO13_13505 [Proteobacteria bacterium]|nr:hypothetical protein [Pseudomonadota bacterium]